MQGGGEVAGGFRKGFALRDDRVDGFQEGFELVFQRVEVDPSVVEPVVVLDEFAARAAANPEGFQHPACGGRGFAHAERLAVLAVLDVHVEGVGFEEDFEVAVVLEDGVRGGFVQHSFQGGAARFDEVGVEAADGLFFGGRGDDHAGVAAVEGFVEPEEVAVAAGDGEFGLFVGFGRCLLSIELVSESD